MTRTLHNGDSEVPMSEPSEPSAPELHIGCVDLPMRLSRQRYFQVLTYLETSATLLGVPRAAVLQRWRQEAGAHGRYGLVAPQTITHRPGPRGYPRHKSTLAPAELAQAGSFRATDLVRREVEVLAQASAICGADVVMFRTPHDFAPSAANRDAMRVFFRDIAPPGRFGDAIRVWEPQGLWELETAAHFAGEIGVVLACDPLTTDQIGTDHEIFGRLPGDDAYFRVTGLGMARRRIDDYALEPLLEAAESYRRVWVAFAHEGKYPDAIRMRRQLGDGGEEGQGEEAGEDPDEGADEELDQDLGDEAE
jgi:uncharacterized protein YecE (DUF72 family)